MKQITKDTILKQGDKSYPAIQTEQGIVWVDKDADLFENDKAWSKSINKIIRIFKGWNNSLKLVDKIIAATFDLEGVPKIELEDEVYELAEKLAYERRNIQVHSEEYCAGVIDGYEEGHKTNKAKWTDEDMVSYLNYVEDNFHYHSDTWHDRDTDEPIKRATILFNYRKSLNSIKSITVDENFKII